MRIVELISLLKPLPEVSYEDPMLAHKLADEALLKFANNDTVTKIWDDIVKDY